jgi:phosphotriesterase-related protein
MIVTTVLGDVSATELGVTLAHEHLLCDLRALWHPPGEDRPDLLPYVDKGPNAPEDRGPLCSDPYVCRPNLHLDDPALAARELAPFRAAGGRAVVELTTGGLSPRPLDLRRISEQAGVHVVAGCGWYRSITHPPGLATLSEGELAEELIRTIREGFPGADGVRPGIIGEIGTGDPVHPDELKALRAAARAQAETGLGLAVHLALWGREGTLVLDTLRSAGANLEKVALCHLGEQPDAFIYQCSLLDRGALISFDTFGAEYSLDSIGRRLATDEERMSGLVRLIDSGYEEQLLISQDVCERLQLRAYGGFGYAHLLTTIVPRLRRRGVGATTIDQLLVKNPARLLAH